jgi:hypothetical protein
MHTRVYLCVYVLLLLTWFICVFFLSPLSGTTTS